MDHSLEDSNGCDASEPQMMMLISVDARYQTLYRGQSAKIVCVERAQAQCWQHLFCGRWKIGVKDFHLVLKCQYNAEIAGVIVCRLNGSAYDYDLWSLCHVHSSINPGECI